MALFKFGKNSDDMLIPRNMMINLIVQTDGQFIGSEAFLYFWLEKFTEEIIKYPELLKSEFTVRQFLAIKIMSLEVAIKHSKSLTTLEPRFSCTHDSYPHLLNFLKNLTRKSDCELDSLKPQLSKLYGHRFRFGTSTDVVLATCPMLIVRMDVEFTVYQKLSLN